MVAIPHSFRFDAKKTGVSVVLFDKPVEWDEDTRVKAVLLFAIAPNGIQLFHNVFDNLVVLLTSRKNLDAVAQSKTYEEFLQNMVDCIE